MNKLPGIDYDPSLSQYVIFLGPAGKVWDLSGGSAALVTLVAANTENYAVNCVDAGGVGDYEASATDAHLLKLPTGTYRVQYYLKGGSTRNVSTDEKIGWNDEFYWAGAAGLTLPDAVVAAGGGGGGGGGTTNVIIGPIISSVNPGNYAGVPSSLEMFVGENKSFLLAAQNADGSFISLAGKDLQLMVETTTATPVEVFHVNSPFTLNSDSTVAQVPVTGIPVGAYEWRFWDFTDNVVLLFGSFKVLKAVRNG